MRLITALWIALRASLTSRAVLIAENLALRHQLSILQVPAKRPQLRPLDRLFWVWLSHWLLFGLREQAGSGPVSRCDGRFLPPRPVAIPPSSTRHRGSSVAGDGGMGAMRITPVTPPVTG